LTCGWVSQDAGEDCLHHLVEGLSGIDDNRPERAKAILVSPQEAAYVLTRVPSSAPLIVLARI